MTRSAGAKDAIRGRISTRRSICCAIRTSRRPASIRSRTISQFGVFEGRAAYAAIGQIIAGGFDAAVLPVQQSRRRGRRRGSAVALQHLRLAGGTQSERAGSIRRAISRTTPTSRRPASIRCSTTMTFGWSEGRDPSAAFDTLGYLMNNPDVAAANINPLEHYPAVRHLRRPGRGQRRRVWLNQSRVFRRKLDLIGFAAANGERRMGKWLRFYSPFAARCSPWNVRQTKELPRRRPSALPRREAPGI